MNVIMQVPQSDVLLLRGHSKEKFILRSDESNTGKTMKYLDY